MASGTIITYGHAVHDDICGENIRVAPEPRLCDDSCCECRGHCGGDMRRSASRSDRTLASYDLATDRGSLRKRSRCFMDCANAQRLGAFERLGRTVLGQLVAIRRLLCRLRRIAAKAHQRTQSFATVYAVAVAYLWSVLHSLLSAWLTHATGSALAPAWYMVVATAIGLFAMLKLGRHNGSM